MLKNDSRNMKNKNLIHSLKCAIQGICESFLASRNFRIQVAIAGASIFLGVLVGLEVFEWMIVLISIGIVLSLETVNTAIETIMDMIEPGYHPAVKKIKDLAAGAVLLISFITATIGVIIFIPKVF